MGTPLTGSGPNAAKLGGNTPGRGGSRMSTGGSATPLTGRSQNSPSNIVSAETMLRNGKSTPRVKKVNLPSLGRDTAGRINLGLGNGS